MTNQPEEAWECYLQIEDSNIAYEVLQLIGNECYQLGGKQFLYAARSFDALLKMDSYPDYIDGLLGACVGCFRYIVSDKWHAGDVGKKSKLSKLDSDNLKEVTEILESLPKGKKAAETIKAWAVQNRVYLS